MMTQDKQLIESRGYAIVKIGGVERAIKHPKYFINLRSQPQPENITMSFMEGLKLKKVSVLTPRVLMGKTAEERDLMVLELINN